jgi:PleD family two-component response regulator
MTSDLPICRALLAAQAAEIEALRRPFADANLAGWQVAEADSWEQAHFLLHHDACDVLLADGGLPPGPDGLAWLAGPRLTPVVMLTCPQAETVAAALESGADVWLPRDLALANPAVLAAGLDQARRWGDLRQRLRREGGSLQESRGRVGRLVDLLWQCAPHGPRPGWFTQRHMLERLQEEVARTARYGTPLSVLLAEFRPAPPAAAWTAERIARVKRRCDVAGQYGPHGFMLLLPNTPRAGAEAVRERLEEALRQAGAANDVPAAAALGVAACSGERATVPGLLRRAEEDLASARGRADGVPALDGGAAEGGWLP